MNGVIDDEVHEITLVRTINFESLEVVNLRRFGVTEIITESSGNLFRDQSIRSNVSKDILAVESLASRIHCGTHIERKRQTLEKILDGELHSFSNNILSNLDSLGSPRGGACVNIGHSLEVGLTELTGSQITNMMERLVRNNLFAPGANSGEMRSNVHQLSKGSIVEIKEVREIEIVRSITVLLLHKHTIVDESGEMGTRGYS